MERLSDYHFSDYASACNYGLDDANFSAPISGRLGMSHSECCAIDVDYASLSAACGLEAGHKIVVKMVMVGRGMPAIFRADCPSTGNSYPLRPTGQGELLVTIEPADQTQDGHIFYAISYEGDSPFYPELDESGEDFLTHSFVNDDEWIQFLDLDTRACPKPVIELSVSSGPARSLYKEGEFLNPAGIILSATYSDGSTAVVDFGFSVAGAEAPLSAGGDVFVEYGGIRVPLDVDVRESDVIYTKDLMQPDFDFSNVMSVSKQVFSFGGVSVFALPYSGSFSCVVGLGELGIGSMTVPLELLVDSFGSSSVLRLAGERVYGAGGSYHYSDGVGSLRFACVFCSVDGGEDVSLTYSQAEEAQHGVDEDGTVTVLVNGETRRVRPMYSSSCGHHFSTTFSGLSNDRHYDASPLSEAAKACERIESACLNLRIVRRVDGSGYESRSVADFGDGPSTFLYRLAAFIQECRLSVAHTQDCFVADVGGLEEPRWGEDVDVLAGYAAQSAALAESIGSLAETLAEAESRKEAVMDSFPAYHIACGGITKSFNVRGNICSVSDGHGNEMVFVRKSRRIEKITLNGKDVARLEYSGGHLSRVRCDDGAVSFEYDSDRIVGCSASGKDVLMSYDDHGLSGLSVTGGPAVEFSEVVGGVEATVRRIPYGPLCASSMRSGNRCWCASGGIVDVFELSGESVSSCWRKDSREILLDFIDFRGDGSIRRANQAILGRADAALVDDGAERERLLDGGVTVRFERDAAGRIRNADARGIRAPGFDRMLKNVDYGEFGPSRDSTALYLGEGVISSTVVDTRYLLSGEASSRKVTRILADGSERVSTDLYSYDSNGFARSVVSSDTGSPMSQAERGAVYDRFGQVLSDESRDCSYCGGRLSVSVDRRTRCKEIICYNPDGRMASLNFFGLGGESCFRHFSYDSFGAVSSIDCGNSAVTFSVSGDQGSSSVATSGHSHTVSRSMDGNDAVTVRSGHGFVTEERTSKSRRSVLVDGSIIYDEDYDLNGLVARSFDRSTGERQWIYRDRFSRIVDVERSDGRCESFSYGEGGKVASHRVSGREYTFSYSADGSVASVSSSGMEVEVSDCKRSLTTRTVVELGGVALEERVTEERMCGHLGSPMPKRVVINGVESAMEYNASGRLKELREGGLRKASWDYDGFGRVKSAIDVPGRTVSTICYDDFGNIRSIDIVSSASGEVISSRRFGYEGNVLVSIDGEPVENDQYGRPISYRGMDVSWSADRPVEVGCCRFSYDATGRRASKNGAPFAYDSLGRLESAAGIGFVYAGQSVAMIEVDGSQYYLQRDAFGSVSAILDSLGVVVATYSYDLYGKPKVYGQGGTENSDPTFIGNLNPIRYRGYYYDQEIGLYWLSSRFYDPDTGRFISPDSLDYLDPMSIHGMNLYVYCDNDPINKIDSSGHLPKWLSFVLDYLLFFTVDGVGRAVGIASGNLFSGLAVRYSLNNAINSIMYAISDESDIDYHSGYISRFERLGYVKKQTGSPFFGANEKRYYGEYSLHMYGWFVTGWSLDKDVALFSDFAKSFDVADVDVHEWDDDHEPLISSAINFLSFLIGFILG